MLLRIAHGETSWENSAFLLAESLLIRTIYQYINKPLVKGFIASKNKNISDWFRPWLFSREFVEILNLLIITWRQILEYYVISWALRWLGCCGLGKNEREKEARGSSFSICWVLGSVLTVLGFSFSRCIKRSSKTFLEELELFS